MEVVRSSCPHLNAGLLDWHDPATWPGRALPSPARNVTLPPHAHVIIRQSVTDRLGVIIIPPTSSLIIGENERGITMDIEGMDVQGALTIGSESCRMQTPVSITLHGSRPPNPVQDIPADTYKGIAVTGGRLDLHGERYYRTWTRLTTTVNTGDTKLYLQDKVNWKEGQEIVLLTTAMKDSREWHQNEVHTIARIEESVEPHVGTVVVLASYVEHVHLATSSYQVEVGLLSRSIVIQGSELDSEPTDTDPLNCSRSFRRFGDTYVPCPYTEITGFGGHVMIHHKGKAYVEGVEFVRMGMTNVLGRYPIHFHLLGDGCSDCYVEASSFHRSYYRCIAIHGTNGMRIAENVAYDVTGFCYYLEDGVEERNTISYNLAAHIHTIGPDMPGTHRQETDVYVQNDQLTNPADVTASGFYITNVHNNLIGNVASGVSGESSRVAF